LASEQQRYGALCAAQARNSVTTPNVDRRVWLPCCGACGLASGDTQDFEIQGHNVIVGKAGICGKPLAATVVPTQ